jgi:hypothetical protein
MIKMPLDEDLEKIKGNGTPAPEGEQGLQEVSSSEENLIALYVKKMNDIVPNDRYKFSPAVVLRYVKYIRFQSHMKPRIIVPKKEIYPLIPDEDKRMLLKETDLGESVPEFLDLTDSNAYNNLPDILELERELDQFELLRFASAGNKLFVIPNMQFASMFVQLGDHVKKYAETCLPQRQGLFAYFIDQGMKNAHIADNDFFDAKKLAKFVKETGFKHVKKLMESVEGLIHSLRSEDGHWQIRENLYSRLCRYTPSLKL